MDKARKWAFIQKALPRMAEATFPYIAKVFGVIDNETGVHEGSGLRCTLSGRRCLATALHVLESASDYPAGIAVSTGYRTTPYRINRPIRFDRDADVAVLVLPDDYPDDPDWIHFWPEERVETHPASRSTDYLFVHGFPRESSHRIPLTLAQQSLPYGAMEMLECDGVPSSLGGNHFGIHFGVPEMVPESPRWAADPRGLTGSPVWRLGASGRPIASWSPRDCTVIGLVIDTRDGAESNGRHFLKAADFGKVLDLGSRIGVNVPSLSGI